MSLSTQILSPVTTRIDKRISRKGKTYEEIYGVERAKIIREKNKQSHIGHVVTEITKQKISKGLTGKPLTSPVWNKGLHGEEHLKHYKKKAVWNKGVPMKEESKEKLRQKKLGKKLTPEHRKKISLGVIKAFMDPVCRNNIKIGLERKMEKDPGWLVRALTTAKKNRKNYNTKIELVLQDNLKKRNIEFDTHTLIRYDKFRTLPDIVLKPFELKIAIFADGIYWHSFEGQKIRDARTNETLQKNGWIVLRFTDKEILKSLDVCLEKIEKSYQSRESRDALPCTPYPGNPDCYAQGK